LENRVQGMKTVKVDYVGNWEANPFAQNSVYLMPMSALQATNAKVLEVEVAVRVFHHPVVELTLTMNL